jgi:hypothetical protein
LRQRRPRKRGNQKQQRETSARDGPRKRLVQAHRQFPPQGRCENRIRTKAASAKFVKQNFSGEVLKSTVSDGIFSR